MTSDIGSALLDVTKKTRDWRTRERVSRAFETISAETTRTKRKLTHLSCRGVYRTENRFGHLGTSIWDAGDWDICVILDGCRLDTFRMERECESIYSVGASSRSWIRRTFDGRDVSSVGYLTGNPFAVGLDEDDFHTFHVEPVQEVHGIETVPPEPIIDRAIELWRRGPPRNLIIHLMQPHVPFRSRPEWFGEFIGTDTWGSTAWERAASGEIPREEWFAAYRDNLVWALDAVDRLASSVDARIAVTADHGNSAGEWGIAGHPVGALHHQVRRVPWTVVDAADTGEHTPEVVESGPLDVEDQLRALGYQ